MATGTKLTLEELALAHELWTAVSEFGTADSCGTCFHVSLSDGNYDAVEWEVENALDASHGKCVALAPLLLRMSKTQREKLSRGGYANVAAHVREAGVAT